MGYFESSAKPRPIGRPLQIHKDVVQTLSFSPDGKTLASGSFDGRIILWDVAGWHKVGEVIGSGFTSEDSLDHINSVSFSPDGHTLAAGIENGLVILWDIRNRSKPVQKSILQGHPSKPDSMAYTAKGDFITLVYYVPTLDGSYKLGLLINVMKHMIIGNGQIKFEDPQGSFVVAEVLDKNQNTYLTEVFDTTSGSIIGNPVPGEFLSVIPEKGVLAYQTTDQST